jgi:hypothetical protein
MALGTLTIDTQVPGSVLLGNSYGVGADLRLEVLDPRAVVFVPEPGGLAMLLAGASLLLALRRRST